MNRKEVVSKYKQTLQPMGIYQIKNTKNGKLLIGSSKNLQGRLNRHKFQLELGSHPNKELQSDFTEVGGEAFLFEIIDCLEPKSDSESDYTDDLKMLEVMWLDKLQPFNEKGYNKKS